MFWCSQHGRCTYLARAWACTYILCLYHCAVCTVLVPLVQCFGMANTGNVPILPVIVLARTLCDCTIAQFLLCLYPVYSVLARAARAMYLYFPCLCLYVRTVLVPLHSVYRACTPCTVFWHGQHGQCTYLARACACTYVLCLYHCTVFWYGPPGQCTYLARLRELLRAMILVFGLARCTCSATHTVFDMDSLSLGDAPIA